MSKIVELDKVKAALDRAAQSADRSGRFDLEDHMPRVKSSMMTDVKYDNEVRELDITFVGGKTYRYFDVPRHIYDALLKAESQGQFFNETIKDGYEFNEVEPPPR